VVSCDVQRAAACAQSVHDPGGAWLRSVADLYLGGLADGFVSALFSSFVGQVIARSLRCCAPHARRHFGAMYDRGHSHRDRPMRNISFLQALTQTVEARA